MQGVPVRLELGPRDLASGTVTVVRRISATKEQVALATAHLALPQILEEFQALLLRRATEFRDQNIAQVDDWSTFLAAVSTGWARAFHCGDIDCEEKIKEESGATPRCVPIDSPEEAGVCVLCGLAGAYGKRVMFARAY